jgi:hypothetical protein
MNKKARRAGRRSRQSIKELQKIDLAMETKRAKSAREDDLARMNTPKRGRATFSARSPDICARCGLAIEIGDVCHYNDDGAVVHDRHLIPDTTYDICQRCFLAKPCYCD